MTDMQVADVMTELEISDIKVVSADVINEALSIIDSALSDLVKRELVSTGEVSDMLLDVRNLLTTAMRGCVVADSVLFRLLRCRRFLCCDVK